MQIKSPPNLRQAVGIAAHSAVEHNFAQKIETKTDVSVEEMSDVFADNFDSVAVEVENAEEPLGVAKDAGIRLVRLHRREVSPAIQPVWVEQAGQLTINDIPYAWTVDLVDDKDRVRDLKTKRDSPRLEDHMLQMTGYALGFRKETGREESDIVIDALVRGRATPPMPRYVPLYAGKISDRRISAFAATLEAVYNGVNAGNFAPNGLTNGACNWCGYQSMCKFRRR